MIKIGAFANRFVGIMFALAVRPKTRAVLGGSGHRGRSFQAASVLNKEGENVVAIFETTRDLNRKLAMDKDNAPPSIPVLEPVKIEIRRLAPDLWEAAEAAREAYQVAWEES